MAFCIYIRILFRRTPDDDCNAGKYSEKAQPLAEHILLLEDEGSHCEGNYRVGSSDWGDQTDEAIWVVDGYVIEEVGHDDDDTNKRYCPLPMERLR